jgi:hypothetical protein
MEVTLAIEVKGELTEKAQHQIRIDQHFAEIICFRQKGAAS